jgi:hypothetical protein
VLISLEASDRDAPILAKTPENSGNNRTNKPVRARKIACYFAYQGRGRKRGRNQRFVVRAPAAPAKVNVWLIPLFSTS